MNNDPASPLPDRRADAHAAGGGATVTGNVDTGGGDFIGRDQIIEGDYVRGDKIVVVDVTPGRAGRNRITMLGLVHRVWVVGVLNQALSVILPINIRLHKQMDAVDQSAWFDLLDFPQQPGSLLPAETHVADIFQEMNQALLILGEPGSGKTILLLMLARESIAQAMRDARCAIPVVLNLSSWGAHRQPFAQWLVEELRVKYNIPRRIATAWVEQDELMLLLDGLDEVAAPHRDACVQAINQFRQEHLTPIALCCRIADYMALPTKLRLNGAVVLRNLTPEQIEQYLHSAGPALAGLRTALARDSVLQELAQTPLMLSIMALAYRDQPGASLESGPDDSTEARRRHLFDAYVDRMFSRTARTRQEDYPRPQAIHWLSWLAKTMTQHGQSTFLIEELQDSCLSSPRRQRLARVGSRVACGLLLFLAAVLGAFCAAWIRTLGDNPIALAATSISALAFGAVYVLNYGVASGLVTRASPILALFGTFALATLTGMLLAWVVSGLLTGSLLFGLFIGLSFGLPGGFAGIALADPRRIALSERLHWSWRRGLPGLLLGIMLSLGGAFVMSEDQETASILANLLVIGPPAAFIGAMAAGVRRTEYVRSHLRPNQGFFEARRNAIVLGLAVLLSIGLVSLSTGLFFPSIFNLSLAVGVGFGLPLAMSTALYAGGGVCIQHIVLRLLLMRQGNIPGNVTRFLDWAVDHIFMRRTGGGYIFLHRTLMDYFCGK
jgi:MFS family permease